MQLGASATLVSEKYYFFELPADPRGKGEKK